MKTIIFDRKEKVISVSLDETDIKQLEQTKKGIDIHLTPDQLNTLWKADKVAIWLFNAKFYPEKE